PYERLYAHAPVEISFGSLARVAGVLARVIGRVEDAERHFEVAMEVERRMRARPWLAHAQHEYGWMLLARGGADDADRARVLLDEALASYRDLGMDAWASRAQAVRRLSVSAPSPSASPVTPTTTATSVQPRDPNAPPPATRSSASKA